MNQSWGHSSPNCQHGRVLQPADIFLNRIHSLGAHIRGHFYSPCTSQHMARPTGAIIWGGDPSKSRKEPWTIVSPPGKQTQGMSTYSSRRFGTLVPKLEDGPFKGTSLKFFVTLVYPLQALVNQKKYINVFIYFIFSLFILFFRFHT